MTLKAQCTTLSHQVRLSAQPHRRGRSNFVLPSQTISRMRLLSTRVLKEKPLHSGLRGKKSLAIPAQGHILLGVKGRVRQLRSSIQIRPTYPHLRRTTSVPTSGFWVKVACIDVPLILFLAELGNVANASIQRLASTYAVIHPPLH